MNQAVLTREQCRNAEAEAMRLFDQIAGPFLCDIPRPEQNVLRKSIRFTYLRDRGIVMERRILRRLSSETSVKCKPVDKATRFFCRTFVHPGFTYTVNGCVDAIEVRHGVPSGIIEVKARKDRIAFHQHELDQITMYLVVSGMPSGRLVQDLSGSLNTSFIMTLDEAEERWDRTLRPLLEASLLSVCRAARSAAEARANAWRPSRRRLAAERQIPQSRYALLDQDINASRFPECRSPVPDLDDDDGQTDEREQCSDDEDSQG